MQHPWSAYCETAELAVELSHVARATGLRVEPEVGGLPTSPPTDRGCLWLTRDAPTPQALAAAHRVLRSVPHHVTCFCAPEPGPSHALAADLGLPATWDVAAAAHLAALLEAGGEWAHRASRRGLPEGLRARLSPTDTKSEPRAGRLSVDDGYELCWSAKGGKPRVSLGAAPTARQVLAVLDAYEREPRADAAPPGPSPGREQASEVLFGPARRLSDPASKAALAPYGVPLPQEELCTSPSRAAAEATRMGFPVRITLASPDLRAWDLPGLIVDGVDNAARVRDVYRQLTSLASHHDPESRVLGVTVTQTRLAGALLSVRGRALTDTLTWLELGFADPHGMASGDRTWLAVPGTGEQLERALRRLRGRDLIFEGTRAQREAACEQLRDLCERLHAFLADFPAEVSDIRLHPVALLVGGGLEVREAAVGVTDAFEQRL